MNADSGGARLPEKGTFIDSTNAAIVIGIAPFKKAAGNLPSEVVDARRMERWLLANEGGGVPRRNLRLITSGVEQDGSIIGPTIDQLELAFTELYKQRNRGPRRSLVKTRLTIVATGPGYGERNGRVILQTANDPKQVAIGLELTSVADRFRDSRIFDEVVLFVDVPRLPGHTGTSVEIQFPSITASVRQGPAAHFYVFSNQYGSRSTPSSPLRLIPTVLSGLASGARNGRGVIDSKSLADYLMGQYRVAGAERALTPEFRQNDDAPIAFSTVRLSGVDRAPPEATSASVIITTESDTPLSAEEGTILVTEGGAARVTEQSSHPPPDKDNDVPMGPPAVEVSIDSSKPASRIGPAAAAVAQRLFGGGLKLVREAGDDELCLNVEDYANAVAQLYAGADDREFCLAIFGPWGRGKSFLMRRVDRALCALDRGYRTIRFSAWKYPSAPEVWVHLYEEFAKAAFNGPWYRVTPNVIRAGVVKHGAGPLLWAYALFAFGLIPLGTLFGAAHAVAMALYPAVGVIGFVLLVTIFTGVRRTKSRLSHEYLTASRHTEKLGLQATIGSDLRVLLMGWIPVRPLGRGFAVWYAVISAALVSAMILRLAQAGELESLAKKYFDWSLIGGMRLGVEIVLVIAVMSLFGWLLHWLREGGVSPRRILLVVDDLDRCKPEHLLSVMESIKLLIEDPDVSCRVQVAMLLEEDILKHAIFEKYGHLTDDKRATLLRTDYDADRLIWENGEKLFTAHLRLPTLAKSEVRELIETFSERRRDDAEEQKKRAAREKYLEKQLANERLREPLSRIRTGTKTVPAEPQLGIERLEEPIYREATAEEIEKDRTEHERRIQAMQDELETIKSENNSAPMPTTQANRVTVTAKVLEVPEVDAILAALDAKTGIRDNLGPRAIRAFIFRYQLARLLLNTLKIDWEPEMLAKSLVDRSFDGARETAPAPISADLTDEQKLQRVVDQVY